MGLPIKSGMPMSVMLQTYQSLSLLQSFVLKLFKPLTKSMKAWFATR
ncbi:hypothetical protein BCEN4_740017 [Burkholderia cenocepacia]|nr:hypothetical protein BCEN4_740017 [Burkholderia cenocepacia]